MIYVYNPKKDVTLMSKCGETCEVYSRVCGYFRPVSNWNKGKKAEFEDRVKFDVNQAASKSISTIIR